MEVKETIELRKRFVGDCNIPIQVLQSPYFEDRLLLLEPFYESKTKYDKLIETIKNNFNSRSDLFLDDYYKTRDAIVNYFHDSPIYNDFISENELFTTISKEIQNNSYPNKEIYKMDMVNSIYLSIDLAKANFQAMRFFSKDIVLNEDTYEGFLKHFTNSEYFIESKYSRQVIFGNLNAKRQITIERYLMHKIINLPLIKDLISKFKLELVSLRNDELVFKINDILHFTNDICKEIISFIKKELDINVNCDIFKLKNINFRHQLGQTLVVFRKDILEKDFNGILFTKKSKYKGMPSQYTPQILRLLSGQSVTDSDLVFSYEKTELAKFLEPLTLI